MRKYTYARVKDGYTVMEKHESVLGEDGLTVTPFSSICHIPAKWSSIDTAEEKARRIVAALDLLEQERERSHTGVQEAV